MPETKRLTRCTSPACSATLMLRWMTPIPPACAMAMAMRDSVTVSMAALRSGISRVIEGVRRVRVSAVAGSTSEAPGTRSTSSKVRASRRSISDSPKGRVAVPCLFHARHGKGSPAARHGLRIGEGGPLKSAVRADH